MNVLSNCRPLIACAVCFLHSELLQPLPTPANSSSSSFFFYHFYLLLLSTPSSLSFNLLPSRIPLFFTVSSSLFLCLHISLFILLNPLLSLTWDETEIHVYVANNNIKPVYMLGISIWNNLRFHTTVQDSNSYLQKSVLYHNVSYCIAPVNKQLWDRIREIY